MIITNFITAINFFILFSLLFFRKNNPLPNKILAFIFLIPGLYFIDNILILTGWIHYAPYSFFFVQIIAIPFPILIFAYTQVLMGEKIMAKKWLTSGSLMLLVYIIYLTIDFSILSVKEKTDYLNSLTNDNYPKSMLIYTSVFYFWQMIYFSVIAFNVYKYNHALKKSVSDFDKIQILYLKRFVITLAFLNLILVVTYTSTPMYYADYLFLPIIASIIYIFILYFSFHHNAIFTQHSFAAFSNETLAINKNIYQLELEKASTSTQLAEKYEKIAELVNNAIDSDKVYRNPGLTLKILSESIGYQPYAVSQVINKQFNKTFFDLINELRIAEAKERLKNFAEKGKVEAIAYEVGFNSRAAFYRAYKKYTGETPTEGRKDK